MIILGVLIGPAKVVVLMVAAEIGNSVVVTSISSGNSVVMESKNIPK